MRKGAHPRERQEWPWPGLLGGEKGLDRGRRRGSADPRVPWPPHPRAVGLTPGRLWQTHVGWAHAPHALLPLDAGGTCDWLLTKSDGCT